VKSTDLLDGLRAQVAAVLRLDAVTLTPASSGAANSAYEVRPASARPDDAPVAFLRCKLADGGQEGIGYTLQREGELLVHAGRLGLPVAPVLATFDRPDALLMGMVAGTSRPDVEEIAAVAPKYMAMLAALHAADAASFPVPQHASAREALEADLSAWEREARERNVADEPLLVLAGRVLRARMPTLVGPPVLVHGDAGAGNFLSVGGEVTAMLDWELAHLGDPHEDLAWLWMRGAHTDFGDPQERLLEYEAASGRPIDRDRLEWYLALVMWKSVVAIHARLRQPAVGQLSTIQVIVALTYDSLLAAQLARLLGGVLPLLTQQPQRGTGPEVNLAEELLAIANVPRDQQVVLRYLRDCAAQSSWERRCLIEECRRELGIEPEDLPAAVADCPAELLLPAVMVVGRHVDRRAMAMPNAVRRIGRAQRIGLGTASQTAN